MSFARIVTMRLKSNSTPDFTRTMENEVVPILRKQKGFQDELVLVNTNGTEAIGISVWDKKESAEAYQRDGFPQVQQALTKVTEGAAKVETYNVIHSTQQKTARSGGSA